MAKIYRCKRSFALGSKGVTRVVPAGKVLSADDPTLSGRQDLLADASLFEPLDDYLERTVEQATAEPGEKRSVTRPRRTRTAKADKTPAKPDPADNAPAKTPAKDAPASGAGAKESAKEGDK